jgi:hypothetical protein
LAKLEACCGTQVKPGLGTFLQGRFYADPRILEEEEDEGLVGLQRLRLSNVSYQGNNIARDTHSL